MSEAFFKGKRDSFSDDDMNIFTEERTKEQMKLSRRAHLIKELVSTQQQFVTDMSQAYESMKAEAALLTDENGRALFVCLSDVVKASKDLYKIWNQELLKYSTNKCDDALIAYAARPYANSVADAFFVYATKYDVQMFQKNENMEEFVKAVIKRLNGYKPLLVDLNTELIKPVQRMFKYSQLFEQLKDHTAENHADYSPTCEMFDIFRQLLRKANEDKRWNDILNEVFKDGSKSRLLTKLTRKFLSFDKVPLDPKLAQEKWKLDTLRKSTRSIRSWIHSHFEMLYDSFKLEKKFLESVLHFCQPEGNISLHTQVGWSPSSFPVCCNTLTTQMSATDCLLNNLTFITIPKLEKNVNNHLDELISMLDDPELLIDELDKTEKELTNVKNQLQQQQLTTKNQTHVLAEKLNELEHTKETLRNNLLKELPIFLRLAEKVLLTITSYACLLLSTLTRKYATEVQVQLTQTKRVSQVDTAMSTESFTQFVEVLHHRMIPEKQKKLSITRSSSLRMHSKGASKHLIPSIVRSIDQMIESLPSKVIGGSDSVRQHTSASSTVVSRIRSPSTPVYRTESEDRNLRSRSSISTNCKPASSGSQIGFRHTVCELNHRLETVTTQSTPTAGQTQLATHRAMFHFTARSPHEISINEGQLVVLLEDHDSSGNKQWFKISVVPTNQIGYVPANYLSSLIAEDSPQNV